MPQSPGLSCEVQVRGDAVHLIAVGELDHQSRDVFDQTVHSVLSGRPAMLVLDLTAVTFLSLEGVAAVVDAGYRAVNGGSTLAIRPSSQVARRLHSVGLTEITADDADQAGRPTAPQPTGDGSGPLGSP
ncbi:STAS domain-containing protein [Phytohabitans sp. LJ34]|uniref:STAS domain-containing protein n=1 Tax=Phytohabitans sp. LJ34 TaxID=3452217 RepID=UPI003F8B4395